MFASFYFGYPYFEGVAGGVAETRIGVFGGCFKRFLFEGRTLVDRDGRRSGVLVEDLVAVDQFCVCLHFYLF